MPPDPIDWLVKHAKERLDAAISARHSCILASGLSGNTEYWNGYLTAREHAYSDALEVQKQNPDRMTKR